MVPWSPTDTQKSVATNRRRSSWSLERCCGYFIALYFGERYCCQRPIVLFRVARSIESFGVHSKVSWSTRSPYLTGVAFVHPVGMTTRQSIPRENTTKGNTLYTTNWATVGRLTDKMPVVDLDHLCSSIHISDGPFASLEDHWTRAQGFTATGVIILY